SAASSSCRSRAAPVAVGDVLSTTVMKMATAIGARNPRARAIRSMDLAVREGSLLGEHAGQRAARKWLDGHAVRLGTARRSRACHEWGLVEYSTGTIVRRVGRCAGRAGVRRAALLSSSRAPRTPRMVTTNSPGHA